MTEKIFIVDDDFSSLELLRVILEKQEYNIQTADIPIMAFEQIRAFQPDLVLLDVWMPGMDGFEVCRKLKSDALTEPIPIIFLSAANNTQEKINGFQAGAVDYLCKPFDQRELLIRVETQLQLAQFKKEKEIQSRALLEYSQKLEQEIAERKKLEQELKKTQQITHVGSWYLDRTTNEVQWTEELYRMYGFDPTLPPPPYTEHMKLFTPESWKLLSTALEKTANTGIPYELELKTVKGDGSNGWMWVRGENVKDAGGKIIGLWGAAQDITTRKNNEEALQKSNDQYNMLIDLAADAFFQGNANGEFILTNKAALKLTGYSKEELFQLKMSDLFSDSLLNQKPLRYDLLNKGETITSEREMIKKDGSIAIVEMHSTKMFDGTYQSFFRDITERKLAEQQLIIAKEAAEESEIRFKALHNASFGGIAIHDKGLILDCNRGLSEISGYTFDELIGMDGLLLIAEDARAQVKANIASGYEKPYEVVGLRKNGEEYPLILEARNIPYRSKQVRVVEFRDISEQKQAELEIIKHKTELQEYFENDISADYLVSAAGKVLSCNKTFLEMFGFEDKVHTEKFNITKLYKHSAERKKMVRLLKDHGKVENYEVDFKDLKGNTVHTIINAIGIFDEKNKLQKIRGYVVNISALKKAEANLHESEIKYRHLFENNPLPMWIFDTENLSFLEVNEAAVVHYGYSRDEFLAMNLKDIRLKEDWDALDADVKSIKKKLDNAGIWRHQLKNGKFIFVNIISHQVNFENRNARMVVANDITARLKAEEAIQNERNLLRTLIDHIPGPIYIKDIQGRKLIMNKSDLDFLNIKDESVLRGKTDLEVMPGIIGARGYNDDMDVLTTGIPILNKEEYFMLHNGEHRWLLTSKIPIFNQNGEIYGLVGIGRDITEQKASNESILKLSIAIEQSPLSIVITNTKGEIEFTNPKFTEVTGYSSIEVRGQNPRIIQSGETPLEVYETMWKTISGGHEWQGEFRNRKKNGELYWESVTIAPIINEKGEIISYIAIKEDITGKKQLIEELVSSKANAEESDRLKSAFLANMSHEIRTPLNGILGFTELMIDPDFDETQKANMARMILDNGDQLLAIINDVLDISKIESGQINLRVSTFEANQLLFDLKKVFEQRAEVNQLQLKLSKNIAAREVNITCDYIKLKQVLSNLVSNAIKYSDSGTIEIGFKTGESEITFYVKDSGIGIPEEFHEKIFDRFRHLEPNRSKLAGGNGLGLAISKSFIELMGGKIWVDSEVGKGSTFYFTLPVQK